MVGFSWLGVDGQGTGLAITNPTCKPTVNVRINAMVVFANVLFGI
jgi:hypothetical protein